MSGRCISVRNMWRDCWCAFGTCARSVHSAVVTRVAVVLINDERVLRRWKEAKSTKLNEKWKRCMKHARGSEDGSPLPCRDCNECNICLKKSRKMISRGRANIRHPDVQPLTYDVLYLKSNFSPFRGTLKQLFCVSLQIQQFDLNICQWPWMFTLFEVSEL